MIYEGDVYRPPSEARSLIIQITIGCANNSCTFCNMYKAKKFRIRTKEEIFKDLEDLLRLKKAGLSMVYVGAESGDENILKAVKKNVSCEEMVKASQMLKEADILLSVTFISGLGGKERMREHALHSATLASKMKADYLSFLTLMLEESAPMLQDIREGKMHLLSPLDVVEEMKIFLKNVDSEGTVFRMNHASNYKTAVDDLAAKGIGCVHTVSGVGFIANLDISMEQLFAKGLNNGFQIRVFPQSLNVKAAIRRKIPRIGGCFECALDGCFGSHDASLHSPYIDDEKDYGVLYYEDERIQDFCKKANRAGLQIELHAIGDRAFDQACRCIKAALDDYPRTDHRHGIIHDCLPTEEGISICKKYDIQMPVQSAFIDWPQEPENYLKSILGKERTEKLNPIRTFLQNDILVSFGSDAPCTEPDPIMWMDKAVNNPNTKEEITIEEALRCCTYNGYKACFDEKDRGSLEIGKIADMVILSENPYEIEKEKIGEIKVERTILKGRPYRSCKENILRQMIKGISL